MKKVIEYIYILQLYIHRYIFATIGVRVYVIRWHYNSIIMQKNISKICRICLCDGSRNIFEKKSTSDSAQQFNAIPSITQNVSSLDRLLEKLRYVTMLKVNIRVYINKITIIIHNFFFISLLLKWWERTLYILRSS